MDKLSDYLNLSPQDQDISMDLSIETKLSSAGYIGTSTSDLICKLCNRGLPNDVNITNPYNTANVNPSNINSVPRSELVSKDNRNNQIEAFDSTKIETTNKVLDGYVPLDYSKYLRKIKIIEDSPPPSSSTSNYKLIKFDDLGSRNRSDTLPPSSPALRPLLKQEYDLNNTAKESVEADSNQPLTAFSSQDFLQAKSSSPPIYPYPTYNLPLLSRSERYKFLTQRHLFVSLKFIELRAQFVHRFKEISFENANVFHFPPPLTEDFYRLKHIRYFLLHEMKCDSRFTINSRESSSEHCGKYYRMNPSELSKMLNLLNYSCELTSELEINIIEIFKIYCKFDLGYQTWVRDTTKTERANLINQLYLLTYYFYPELNKQQLEAIIKRGIYTSMQQRLRIIRKAQNRIRLQKERPRLKEMISIKKRVDTPKKHKRYKSAKKKPKKAKKVK